MDSGRAVSQSEARAAYHALAEPSLVPSDLLLQLVLLPPRNSPGGYVELYYAAEPIGSSETNFDFFVAGGLILRESPTQGQSAEMVEETLGVQDFSQHGRITKVGQYNAAIVHDRALPTGDRTYHLYWSDGTTDFVIGTSTTPAEAVDMARSMFCGL
jgi:hypothetical protein